jgi:acetoin utilization deacetylase AcuC-like enzyme
VGVVYDEDMLLHKSDIHHPERPDRAKAIYDNLVEKSILDKLTRIDAKLATDDQLKLVHSDEHI